MRIAFFGDPVGGLEISNAVKESFAMQQKSPPLMTSLHEFMDFLPEEYFDVSPGWRVLHGAHYLRQVELQSSFPDAILMTTIIDLMARALMMMEDAQRAVNMQSALVMPNGDQALVGDAAVAGQEFQRLSGHMIALSEMAIGEFEWLDAAYLIRAPEDEDVEELVRYGQHIQQLVYQSGDLGAAIVPKVTEMPRGMDVEEFVAGVLAEHFPSGVGG